MDEVQETVVEEVSVDAEQVEAQEEVVTEVVEETNDDVKPDNNGEAIKREVERRESKIKQQYETQMEEIRKENDYLDKQARIYGYADRNEYKQAIDAHLAQQEIEQEANKYNVPEEFIRKELQPLKNELDSLRAEREQLKEAEVHRKISDEVAELTKNNPDFEGMKDDVFKFAIENNIKLEHAYKLLTYDTKLESAKKEKEQEVLAKVTGRDSKQVLSSIDSPNTMTLDPANMTDAEIQSISDRVRRGERITF